MSVLQIRKAQREGARLVISIAGQSGCGKTYTAIQIGYGLANYDASKVGFLDTENRRGSLYSEILRKSTRPTEDQFYIGDLEPPFSPERYSAAILEFQAAGVEVLVIDSVSHEWEGEGGCDDIATAGDPKIARWNLAKSRHKKFMNTLLQCNMHIIVCVRAREKMDFKNPKEPKSLGIQPIQEKNFMFETTASMMLHKGGSERDITKCPAELAGIFGAQGVVHSGYLNADHGAALRAWVDGAKQLDPEVERNRNILRSISERGVDELSKQWAATPKAIKAALGVAFLETVKTAAAEYDRSRKALETGGNEVPNTIAALNESIGAE